MEELAKKTETHSLDVVEGKEARGGPTALIACKSAALTDDLTSRENPPGPSAKTS